MGYLFEAPLVSADLHDLTPHELNIRVTDLILRAERLDSSVDMEVRHSTWDQVSRTEEAIAEKATSELQSKIAKRGAITAAQKSGNQERVVKLFEKYGASIWVTEATPWETEPVADDLDLE